MSLRLAVAIALTAATLLCAGCFGSHETDDVAYILVIGIDQTPDSNLRVTYQIATPHGAGGDASGASEKAGGGQSWITNTIEARSPAETRMLLNSTMSRYPNVSHTTAFIFGEETARAGIGALLHYLVRTRDFRETLFLVVVRGTAEEYITRNKPKLEANIGKYYETFINNNESGYFLRTDLHEFYTRLKITGSSPFTLYTGLNPKTGENNPAGPKTPEQVGEPYLPGGIPRTGSENPPEFLGMAVFRGDRMVGTLDSDETRAVAILLGQFSRGFVGLTDPLQPQEYVTVNLRNGETPKITAELNDGTAVFTAEVLIEGELTGAASGINYEMSPAKELLEAQVSQMLEGQMARMIRHTQEMGTDPVGFGFYLRAKFRTIDEAGKANMTDIYQRSEVRVKVITKIRRSGLMWRTMPIRTE